MKKIRWLHLSDIHLNKKDVDTRRMRKHLIQYLENKKLNCDYIFFTGDLRYAPYGDFSDDTIAFFDELCSATGTDKSHLFLVPGNHDIDRDCEDRGKAIERILSSETGYYHSINGIIQKEDITDISSGKRQYVHLMEQLFHGDEQRLAHYRNMEKPHFCVETDDFNILHIDSTLSYSESRERELVLGTDLLMNLFETINPQKPSILLSHYSFDFLSRNEQTQVLKLMEDYNIQLWFAGHEHMAILRRQRDYFFEFQCGNLLHEDETTKGAVIIGEYSPEKYSGSLQVHVWNSPDDWTIAPYICNQSANHSIYNFVLQDPVARSRQFADIAQDTPEESGRYCNFSIVNTADSERKPAFKTSPKEESIPVVESKTIGEGFLYLDKNVLPFGRVVIRTLPSDYPNQFLLESDGFQVLIAKNGANYTPLIFSYNLSGYSDVADRLLHFDNIRKYIHAKDVEVKIAGNHQAQFSYKVPLPNAAWDQIMEETEFWYNCMVRIAKIEDAYKIKFFLPVKVTENTYHMIDILSDSIERKSCRHLPGIPMKHPGFSKKFRLQQEVWLNDGGNLPALTLFGYRFRPSAQYILPGIFLWDKKSHTWQSDRKYGGVAVRVEFVLDTEQKKDEEIFFTLPCGDFFEKSHTPVLKRLTQKDACMLKTYGKTVSDVQEIRNHFHYYEDQIVHFIQFDLSRKSNSSTDKTATKLDRLKVNELTDAIVSSGMDLIDRINTFWEDRQQENETMGLSEENDIGKYGGYLFMVFMRALSIRGYLPVSQDSSGNFYYDLFTLKDAAQQEDLNELDTVFQFLKSSLESEKIHPEQVDHYLILRNFMFAVAEFYLDYYRKASPLIAVLSHASEKLFEDSASISINSEKWKDYSFCLSESENTVYLCKRGFHLVSEFSLYQSEAQDSFMEKCIGSRGSGI